MSPIGRPVKIANLLEDRTGEPVDELLDRCLIRGSTHHDRGVESGVKECRTPSTISHSDPRQQDSLYSQKPDPSALARLFDEWMQGDESEQRETFEILRRSLDEDRPAGYKLFS